MLCKNKKTNNLRTKIHLLPWEQPPPKNYTTFHTSHLSNNCSEGTKPASPAVQIHGRGLFKMLQPINDSKRWGNPAGVFARSSEKKTFITNYKKKNVPTCRNWSRERCKVFPEILLTGAKVWIWRRQEGSRVYRSNQPACTFWLQRAQTEHIQGCKSMGSATTSHFYRDEGPVILSL